MRLNGSSLAGTPIALHHQGVVLEAASATVAFSIEVEPHPPESLKAISLNMLASFPCTPALGGGRGGEAGRCMLALCSYHELSLPLSLSLAHSLCLPPSRSLSLSFLCLTPPPVLFLSLPIPGWGSGFRNPSESCDRVGLKPFCQLLL